MITDTILERFSQGKKILKGARRKQISYEWIKYLLNILETSDEENFTVHYWIPDVIFRFIGKYAKFLNFNIIPIDSSNYTLKTKKEILGQQIFKRK